MKPEKIFAKKINSALAHKSDNLPKMPGVLGNEFGELYFDAIKKNAVYVQVGNETVIARCPRFSPKLGAKVWVGWANEERTLYQILSTRTTDTSNPSVSGDYAPAKRYRYLAQGGGQDPLWLEKRAWLPLRVGMTDPASLYVSLYSGNVWTGTELLYIPAQTINLTAKIPGTAGKAALVMLTVDTAGDIIQTKGDEVDIADLIPAGTEFVNAPNVPADTVEIIALIRVYAGQTEIREGRSIMNGTNRAFTDFIDVRGLYSVGGGGYTPPATTAENDFQVGGVGGGGGWVTKTLAQVETILGIVAAYVHPNHSGDVTSVGDGAQTIAAKAVTLAKMDDMATASLIYRKAAGAGVPEVNTLAQLKTDLAVRTPTITTLMVGSGDYTPPVGCVFVEVICVGGGGSGGSGCRATNGANARAGGGAGGGAKHKQTYLASQVGTIAYTVGAGGAAKTGTTGTTGTAGGQGGTTLFGTLLSAFGGGAGAAARNDTTTVPGGGGGGIYDSGDSGAGGGGGGLPTDGGETNVYGGGAGGGTGTGQNSQWGGGGGGGNFGFTAGYSSWHGGAGSGGAGRYQTAGSIGGATLSYTAGGGGAGGTSGTGTTGGAGGNGTDGDTTKCGTGGGGGGGANTATATGGAGGTGGFPGGAGGGGGNAGASGGTGGASGKGGDGVIYVFEY